MMLSSLFGFMLVSDPWTTRITARDGRHQRRVVMTAGRDLREAILRTTAVAKSVSDTARQIREEASAAVTATGPAGEVDRGPRNDPQP